MSEARISASLTRSTSKLVYLSVSLIGFSRTVQALIDSGATLNFIHEALVASLGVVVQSCPPVKVRLAYGRILTHTNRKVTLNFTIAGVPHTQTFYVAPIGMHSVILGMPWLESVNPVIDWRHKTVLSYFVHDLPASSPSTSSESLNLAQSLHEASSSVSSLREATTTSPKRKSNRRRSKIRKPLPPHVYEPKTRKLPPTVRLTRRINSNDEVYLLFLDEILSPSKCLSAMEATESPEIPKEYRNLTDVFSKSKSEELPPHRGSLDHSIPLEKDAKPVFGPIYNLSETELQVLREYIDKNLRKRFIRPSTSPFGSPVLFVKKPDGSL